MAWISGLEKKRAPWHLRWFFRATRKLLGKELMPVNPHLLMLVCVVAPATLRSFLNAFPIHQS